MALTESLAMTPAASVSGFYLAHPQATYFNVGKIGDDQLADWAAAQRARRVAGAPLAVRAAVAGPSRLHPLTADASSRNRSAAMLSAADIASACKTLPDCQFLATSASAQPQESPLCLGTLTA